MPAYFACRVLLGCLMHLARRAALLLALCALWPLLAGSSPAPQSCTESSAAFVLRQSVEQSIISNGTRLVVPHGYAVAWSCTSLDEARAELARRVADVK